jgi:flagellar hook-associated protein 1 FlgK
MPGLFGTLNIGQSSLQAQQQGVGVAGQNMANVNRAGYSRQRLILEATPPLTTHYVSVGTGVQVVGIQQTRSSILDQQMQNELSVHSSLDAQQQVLQTVQVNLGQSVDTGATSSAGTSGAQNSGGPNALAGELTDLFNSFQGVATQPASTDARQNLVLQAQSLAQKFNQIDQRFDNQRTALNQSMQADVGTANQALARIADLNTQIANAEAGAPGTANDLRDTRQQQLEALAKIVKIDTHEDSDGTVDVSVAGTTLVSGRQVADTLEAYDPGNGNFAVRTHNGSVPLALTGGSLQGTMEARDGTLTSLQNNLDTIACTLITQVNQIHAAGFSLTGTTGAAFFTGTDAGTIAVNQNLINDPTLVQASGVNGAGGNNQVALALAKLATVPQAALGNQTFSANYSQAVAGMGQSLASVNSQLDDQQKVETLLIQQRDAVSGVSLDEEMTQLMKYQMAFQASAHLINTVDQMLQTVLNMG